MLIHPETIREILQENGAPTDCPQIVGHKGWWGNKYDTLNGIESSEDLEWVVCKGMRAAFNEDTKYPACESCKLRCTNIIAMAEYRRRIGLPD